MTTARINQITITKWTIQNFTPPPPKKSSIITEKTRFVKEFSIFLAPFFFRGFRRPQPTPQTHPTQKIGKYIKKIKKTTNPSQNFFFYFNRKKNYKSRQKKKGAKKIENSLTKRIFSVIILDFFWGGASLRTSGGALLCLRRGRETKFLRECDILQISILMR